MTSPGRSNNLLSNDNRRKTINKLYKLSDHHPAGCVIRTYNHVRWTLYFMGSSVPFSHFPRSCSSPPAKYDMQPYVRAVALIVQRALWARVVGAFPFLFLGNPGCTLTILHCHRVPSFPFRREDRLTLYLASSSEPWTSYKNKTRLYYPILLLTNKLLRDTTLHLQVSIRVNTTLMLHLIILIHPGIQA